MSRKLVEASRRAVGETLLFLQEIDWGKDAALRNQIARSAFSVPSNISEGLGRGIGVEQTVKKSTLHFYRIALGSLKECVTQLEILKISKSECSLRLSELIEQFCDIEKDLALLVGEKPILEADYLEENRTHFLNCACGGKSTVCVMFDGTVILDPCEECKKRTPVRLAPTEITPDLIHALGNAANIAEQISLLFGQKKEWHR